MSGRSQSKAQEVNQDDAGIIITTIITITTSMAHHSTEFTTHS